MQHSQSATRTMYPAHYAPELLLPVPRISNRQGLGIAQGELPFCGADIWNAYELSWLNGAGLPQVARGRFIFPCTSDALIESKSLKLYLNSLNQHRFSDADAARSCIAQDLSQAAGATVEVHVQPFSGMQEVLDVPGGICLDDPGITCDLYELDAELLGTAGANDLFEAVVDEVLYTDLFRSLCPLTGQPDWATITVCYQGPQIDRAALLRYLVSYRQHGDYHEHCVERIFCDIRRQCRPQALTVEANFLRRGGLDINPVRATSAGMNHAAFPRYNRQ